MTAPTCPWCADAGCVVCGQPGRRPLPTVATVDGPCLCGAESPTGTWPMCPECGQPMCPECDAGLVPARCVVCYYVADALAASPEAAEVPL